MAQISIPTSSALAHSQRVPSASPAVFRILNKLSRASLISLALDWLEDGNQALSAPYLQEEEDDDDESQDLYPALPDLEQLREYYTDLQARKGGKREVVDRIIEGDWRNGLSLYQIAMADMQYLYSHPLSQKWTALKVIKLDHDSDSEETPKEDLPTIPRFHPSTFLQNLQREILPDVKAYYSLERPPKLPMFLLRIHILDSPYNTSLALASLPADALDASKTIYISFPDNSPHVFVSLTTSAPGSTSAPVSNAGDTRSLRSLILDGIPKAFSRPGARFTLQSTNLSARSLEALVARRGQGRAGAAAGGWGVYATERVKTDTPLNTQLPTPPGEESESEDELARDPATLVAKSMKRKVVDENAEVVKRRKLVAKGRFGESAKDGDGKGIERLDVRIEDPFPDLRGVESAEANGGVADGRDDEVAAKMKKRRISTLEKDLAAESERRRADGGGNDDDNANGWAPQIRITFHGSHVFAGVRELVECGIIDGEKMPGWMTGEEGVSIGVIREGRIRGFKGSGI